MVTSLKGELITNKKTHMLSTILTFKLFLTNVFYNMSSESVALSISGLEKETTLLIVRKPKNDNVVTRRVGVNWSMYSYIYTCIQDSIATYIP